MENIMGQRIRELRQKQGLTQERLGEYIGVSRGAINKIEKGTTENLKSVLFKDNEDTSYTLGEKTIYVDIPFKIDDEYDVIYIVANPLIENIVK